MRLQELGLKYGTDKATFHKYLDFYERVFPKQIDKLLEIGIEHGHSLRMWKDWFGNNITIEGWDIYLENISMNLDDCIVKYVNQYNREKMKNAITGIYDIIIDDGAHTKRSIEISFSFLFQYCKIYVIEDLHAARQYYPHEISTLELLKTKWSSPYTNQNEQNYIDKYMKVGEIYEPSFYSSTAIIYNKFYV